MKKSNIPVISPEMKNLLNRAQSLVEIGNIEGLKDLARMVWRRLQSRLMLEPYLIDNNTANSEVSFDFLPFGALTECSKGKSGRSVSLREPVITFPWHPQRILTNLGVIGNDRPRGTFRSSNNHRVRYYWPIMLFEVTGGNHSIAQGILQGEGEVLVDEWFDLTQLINRYACCGEFWFKIADGKIVAPCTLPELGMAWEIGRLLMRESPSEH